MSGLDPKEREEESYDRYVRSEWARFSNDSARSTSAREAIAGLVVTRVLDVGCGAGQELRPFLVNQHVLGVGMDVAGSVGKAGRELFTSEQPGSHVAFVRAAAENLPFGPSTFDVVICRLALPYTDNAQALAEMARVMTRGGVLLLKFHHARYYVLELREALASGSIKSAIHACRVLLAGALYHLTGSQPGNRFLGGETFQTMWLLERQLRQYDLEVRRMLADSAPAAPSLMIMRRS